MKIPMPLYICAVTHHTQTFGTDVGPIYSITGLITSTQHYRSLFAYYLLEINDLIKNHRTACIYLNCITTVSCLSVWHVVILFAICVHSHQSFLTVLKSIIQPNDRLIELTDQPCDWLNLWLTAWLTDELTNWLTEWCNEWLPDWLTDLLINRFID